MKKRKYQQKARAEQAQETRQQIVEAAVKLHEELGPVNTSIKAIAEGAGVQRLTVYRHFPDDASLFEACTSHWFALHPPPPVADVDDPINPQHQTEKTLLGLYRYYRQTERMWYVALRDVEELEALQGPMNKAERYFDNMHNELLSAWKPEADIKKQLSMTLRHCLRFSTWRSLKAEKLSDKKMVELVMPWLIQYLGSE
ncbi:MAG: TetR family transcriptional regulator [Gammaproteobacteria bacterium]|nr:TetR family transcriptional regulator [Gammaproteobacteria bacterium]